jgi:hypothetical protein
MYFNFINGIREKRQKIGRKSGGLYITNVYVLFSQCCRTIRPVILSFKRAMYLKLSEMVHRIS